MSKELKLLLISFGLIIAGIAYSYVTSHYKCETVRYQDLSGEHSRSTCEWVQ
jgi:hypothetical protein